MAVLDVGQVGSTRRAANQASYPANVRDNPPIAPDVINPLPGQPVVFVDKIPSQGRLVYWTGLLAMSSSTVLTAIRSDLSKFALGQTRTDGVPSAINTAYVQATMLTDAYDEILSLRAVLLPNFRWGEFHRLNTDATRVIGVPLTLTFRILD